MLQFALALLEWLPRIFIWILAPVALAALSLVVMPRTRSRAALAFMIAATVSASFLSIETAALVYVCCDQAGVILSILLDFRPGVTAGFLTALLTTIGAPLLGLIPMIVAAACSGLAALALRGNVVTSDPARFGDQTGTQGALAIS